MALWHKQRREYGRAKELMDQSAAIDPNDSQTWRQSAVIHAACDAHHVHCDRSPQHRLLMPEEAAALSRHALHVGLSDVDEGRE